MADEAPEQDRTPRQPLGRTVAAYALTGAFVGVLTGIHDVGPPPAIHRHPVGALEHTAIGLGLHAMLATITCALLGLLIVGVGRLSAFRRARRSHVAGGVALSVATVALVVGPPSGMCHEYCWQWLAVVVVGTGVIRALAECEAFSPVGSVRAAFAVLAGVAVLVWIAKARVPGMQPAWRVVGAISFAAVAAAAAGMVGGLLARNRTLALGAAALALVGAAVVGGAWLADRSAPTSAGRAPVAGEAGQRPNVILVSVDTLRADHVGYMDGRARTPTIDRLAASSHVFERAYSVAPWTRPSFAALSSSRYPSQMGVGRVLGREASGLGITPYQWRTDVQTFPEVMSAAGYRTTAVVTNANLTREANADQGFDIFRRVVVPPAPGELQIGQALTGIPWFPTGLLPDKDDIERADHVNATLREVLPEPGDRPLLLWLHYMDPHQPYDPPTLPPERRIHPDIDGAVAGRVHASMTERQQMVEAYVAEVEYCDGWLKDLIATLRGADLWDESLIVFWSDHGEEFWDHGSWEHGHTFYDELLHVPLLVRLPGQTRSARHDEFVSLMDVGPSVLDLCGLQPTEDMRGRSLAPTLRGERPVVAAPVWLEGRTWGGIRKGRFDGRYKLIYDVRREQFRLYDVLEDPGERHNIHGMPAAPDTSRMERELVAWTESSLAEMARTVGRSHESVSADVMDQLRDLGYAQ